MGFGTSIDVIYRFVFILVIPYLLQEPLNMGARFAYVMGFFAACGWIFAVFFVPETKGKRASSGLEHRSNLTLYQGRSLEEMDELFAMGLWAWQFNKAETKGVGRRVADVEHGMEIQGDKPDTTHVRHAGNAIWTVLTSNTARVARFQPNRYYDGTSAGQSMIIRHSQSKDKTQRCVDEQDADAYGLYDVSRPERTRTVILYPSLCEGGTFISRGRLLRPLQAQRLCRRAHRPIERGCHGRLMLPPASQSSFCIRSGASALLSTSSKVESPWRGPKRRRNPRSSRSWRYCLNRQSPCSVIDSQSEHPLQPKMALNICQPPLVVGEPTSGLPALMSTRKRHTAPRHTIGQVPDIALDTEATGTVTRLGDIPADAFGERVILKVSDPLREEAGSDEKQEGS